MARTLRQRLNQVFLKIGKRIVFGLDKFVAHWSAVDNKPFFDPGDFAWSRQVEQDWPKIRAEIDELLKYRQHLPNFQDLSKDQAYLTKDDGWKTVVFYAYGLKAPGMCRRCPQTARALKNIPGMKTAFFSILAPHKKVPPHRGPYKGVLRYHLGLVVPEPPESCGIRVGDQTRHWREGESMIFDDTFDHEAWNDSEEVRAVLFIDFIRPMRFPGSLLNRLFIWVIALSPFVLGSAGNQLAWEKKFNKIVNDPS
ncbi:MAG: aspartyl beta-hydroxylase [Hyphomicrobiales bacterium]|nr:MAG: aspartyl beta-hydroxylase [Hyphomicrobiales bacterium]